MKELCQGRGQVSLRIAQTCFKAETRREPAHMQLSRRRVECPEGMAAQACQGFCRAELDLFREVLGPELEVTRTDHIAARARRCAYRITPSAAA